MPTTVRRRTATIGGTAPLTPILEVERIDLVLDVNGRTVSERYVLEDMTSFEAQELLFIVSDEPQLTAMRTEAKICAKKLDFVPSGPFGKKLGYRARQYASGGSLRKRRP
jgi:hypothetical protein